MRFITAHDGKLHTFSEVEAGKGLGFCTGIAALDRLLPKRRLARGAIHEVLNEPTEPAGLFFALLLARAGMSLIADCRLPISDPESDFRFQISDLKSQISDFISQISNRKLEIGNQKFLLLSDPHRLLYPPAVAAMGLPLERVIMLRPKTAADELWAIAEALRCGGVGAVVASLDRLTKIQARRLQLAAERGGGVGILLRPAGAASTHYAAATRWLVRPQPGDRGVQRWRIELIHGHGGRLNQAVTLEHHRETNLVRASEELADRPPLPALARASA